MIETPDNVWIVTIGIKEIYFSEEEAKFYMQAVVKGEKYVVIRQQMFSTNFQTIVKAKTLKDQEHLEVGHFMCVYKEWHGYTYDLGIKSLSRITCKNMGGCKILTREQAFQIISESLDIKQLMPHPETESRKQLLSDQSNEKKRKGQETLLHNLMCQNNWKKVDDTLKEWKDAKGIISNEKLSDDNYKYLADFVERGRKYYREHPEKYKS